MKSSILSILCLLFIGTFIACKDKNASNSNTTEIPGRMSTDPRGLSGKLSQTATEAGGVVFVNTVDPICDMKIDQTAEDTAHYQGKVWGFCSESCKETFQENPGKYAGK